MINRILSININKWYIRFAVLNLLVTVIYFILLDGFEISDIIGFNLAYHMFHWFPRLVTYLMKRNFNPEKLKSFKFETGVFIIFFSFFGIIVLVGGLFFVVVYRIPFPPFTIGFAILLGACAILHKRRSLLTDQ